MNKIFTPQNDKFILLEQTKFHVESSKKFLIDLKLKPYNLDPKALKLIEESFDTLLLNLESLIKSETKITKN